MLEMFELWRMVRNIKTKIMKREFSQRKVTIMFMKKNNNHESCHA